MREPASVGATLTRPKLTAHHLISTAPGKRNTIVERNAAKELAPGGTHIAWPEDCNSNHEVSEELSRGGGSGGGGNVVAALAEYAYAKHLLNKKAEVMIFVLLPCQAHIGIKLD